MLYIHTAQNILYLAQSKIDLFHLQKNPKEWQIQNTKTSVEILRFAEVCHCSVKIPNNLQDKGQTSQRCLCSTLHCCHHHCPPAFLLIPPGSCSPEKYCPWAILSVECQTLTNMQKAHFYIINLIIAKHFSQPRMCSFIFVSIIIAAISSAYIL